MALTAYCKKCRREVDPGEICPLCGTKLPKTAVHAAWVMERRPAADWMCWNAVMRWLIPAGLVLMALVLLPEWISGGTEAVERLIRGGFFATVGGLAAGVLLLVLLALLCQGKELADYVVDSRGVHVTKYLPDPTPLKLIARLKSPRLMDQADPEAEAPVIRLEEKDLPWREVARVQLWTEKCCILFYAPAWWQRLAVWCTPFTWDDALYFVRDKLGKKKSVELPEYLRAQAQAGKAAPARRSAARRTVQPETEAPWETGAGFPGYGDPAPENSAEGRGSPWENGESEPVESEELRVESLPRKGEALSEQVPENVGEQMALDLPPEDGAQV